jgi:hypothetical protein
MQNPPYRARVDFYMVYYSPADHSELKRDLYTANFVFAFRSRVPNELIPINPLGLTVTYFREDQAFKCNRWNTTSKEVAGRRRWATSAQPPRATTFFPQRLSS